jgi:hypothetical protein
MDTVLEKTWIQFWNKHGCSSGINSTQSQARHGYSSAINMDTVLE